MQSARSASAATNFGTIAIQKGPVLHGKSAFARLPALGLALLVFTSLTLRAEEPVITLAMVRPDQFQPSVYAHARFSGGTPRLFVHEEKISEKTAAPAATLEAPQFPFSTYLERVETPVSSKRLFSTRRSLRDYGYSRASACVECGYGSVSYYRPRTLYERNGGGWEEPSCGYLKLSFSF